MLTGDVIKASDMVCRNVYRGGMYFRKYAHSKEDLVYLCGDITNDDKFKDKIYSCISGDIANQCEVYLQVIIMKDFGKYFVCIHKNPLNISNTCSSKLVIVPMGGEDIVGKKARKYEDVKLRLY